MQYGSIIKGGGATPCCEWESDSFKGPAREYADSPYLRDIKEKMLDHDMGSIENSCRLCIDQEKLGIPSRRNIYHRWYENSDSIPRDILYYDYRPSNLCNLKCRMCSPLSSSQIAKEMGVEVTIRDTSDFHSLDFSKMETINVVGGEPSIDPLVHEFLEKLVTDGVASNVQLRMTTNATNVNEKWKRIISAFKWTSVIISLDGIGSTYEYIRTNADWETVEKNCQEYLRYSDEITYQVVASILNVVNVEEWLPWFSDSGVTTTIWPVKSDDGILTLATMPDDMRSEKLQYLSEINHDAARTIENMLIETKFNPTLHSNLSRWLKRMDLLRGTDFRSVSANHFRLLQHG